MRTATTVSVTVFATLVLLVGQLQAALLFQEEFDYDVGSDLNGQDPGYGGTWTVGAGPLLINQDANGNYADGSVNNSGGTGSQKWTHPFNMSAQSGVITFTANVEAGDATHIGGVGFSLGSAPNPPPTYSNWHFTRPQATTGILRAWPAI